MTDLETGYLIVGFLFVVSLVGLICITLDMFFNREQEFIIVKPKYESINLAEFVTDETEDDNKLIIDF